MRGERRQLLIVLAVGVLCSAVGAVALERASTPPADNPVADLATAVESTTTTSTAVAAPPSSLPVRRPVAPPADEYAPEPVVEIGTIEIPKIGLVHRVYEGITLHNIDKGPSHWPGTAMPGEVGNAVFAGHRVTKSRPFRHIDQLALGDEVIFVIGGVRTVYEVTSSFTVTPRQVEIADPTPTPTATLYACHPPGSARQRYVVRLALKA